MALFREYRLERLHLITKGLFWQPWITQKETKKKLAMPSLWKASRDSEPPGPTTSNPPKTSKPNFISGST